MNRKLIGNDKINTVPDVVSIYKKRLRLQGKNKPNEESTQHKPEIDERLLQKHYNARCLRGAKKYSTEFHSVPAKRVCIQPALSNSCSTESFRSKITAKLQNLFDGFVSELQNISHHKQPDLASLFSSKHSVTSVFRDSCVKKSLLQSNKGSNGDAASLALQNFINSAKSRISGLLSKEQEVQDSNKRIPEGNAKSLCVDPLQIQISLKLQNLLCKALDNQRTNNNDKNKSTSPSIDVISETEWQDLSHMLQDFMSSARKKLSTSLSNESNKHQENGSLTIPNQSSRGKSSINRSPCDTVQPSPNGLNKNRKNSCGVTSISGQEASQYKCTKSKEEILQFQAQDLQSAISSKMESSNSSDSSSQDVPIESMVDVDMHTNGSGGILLLGEAEKAPDYLDLEVETDVDDPSFENPDSDSDEEIIVLGEKRPTYQEITLDEDDDGEVFERVVELEKPVRMRKDLEELLYDCPKCEKKFRVESLLKFHIRMHGVVESHGISPSSIASVSEASSESYCVNTKDNSPPKKSSNPNQSYLRREKENNMKSKSKNSSHKHKTLNEKREKQGRRRTNVV